jgi:hypothetical protein
LIEPVVSKTERSVGFVSNTEQTSNRNNDEVVDLLVNSTKIFIDFIDNYAIIKQKDYHLNESLEFLRRSLNIFRENYNDDK